MSEDLPFLDLTSPGFSTRSQAVAEARSRAWCARTEMGLAVLRHREAGLLLRDRRLRQGSYSWPETVRLQGSFVQFWQRSIISQEGADHRLLRRLAQAALSRDYVAGQAPAFGRIAEDLMSGLSGRNNIEFMSDFSEPFAGRAIAHLLGLDARLASGVAQDASALGLAMGLQASRHAPRINAACDRLMQLAESLVARVKAGRDRTSYVARLVREFEAHCPTGGQALLDLIVISIFGGVDTTRAQLGFAVGLFADHPEQWRILRADPSLVPDAIEEVVRTRPTTTWSTREALEDFEFGGITIRKGETLHILVHATAHDPRVSADQEFDVTRPRKMHFGFGGGAHHCLGQLVARTDMAAALTVMLRNWSALSWAGRPDYLPETGNTSPVHLPIRPEWTQVPA